ncbi:secreted RxLR effector peptide protein, putative [Phytophthora infestans T30-4]|uniref:Secreted RxLR effector peptide protein, putative n=1 Tax=Phytophthora infestans (strain T30-4) TaxID=403677 RepID=D0NBY1_PHYIT|nr:secreted RxLR effector peptide protein, putative [Phytophthora infestans T30-4]EEY55286.1 secreted RxLR effector peptide protein, putative [Phytophthora infestans T30-4]|eukprot:XP_002903510.1 secreted RxLR effector peptide protein, putative [Phytophthora infestans T30-4]
MRLLLWTMLVALATVLSCCEADSPNVRKMALSIRGVAADDVLDSKNTKANDGRSKIASAGKKNWDEEERGLFQKLRALFNALKLKFENWMMKSLQTSFQEMANKGTTVTELTETFRVRLMGTGLWSTPSGYKSYINSYRKWCQKYYPDLAQ